MQIIPVTNDSAQYFTTQLGGVKLNFDIQWNDRSNLFTLTLTNDITDVVYFQGTPLVLGVDILAPYNYKLGMIWLVDTTNSGKEANLATLGDMVILCWASEYERLHGLQ